MYLPLLKTRITPVNNAYFGKTFLMDVAGDFETGVMLFTTQLTHFEPHEVDALRQFATQIAEQQGFPLKAVELAVSEVPLTW